MRTLQTQEAKAHIAALLDKIKAGKASTETQRNPDMAHTVATTIRYQRMAYQEQRG